MLDYLKEESNITLTENGAVTPLSTGDFCMDLFATAGALRDESEDEIIRRFDRAYAEDADMAVKLLFFARDIRGGLGERRFFRVIFNYLADCHPESVRKNIEYVAEYGRYDDLLSLLGTRCEKEMIFYIKVCLDADISALNDGGNVSLLAKWLPSVNASSKKTVSDAKKLANALGLRPAEYRKMISALRKRIDLIENYLRDRDYTFDYEKQPSCALFKYKKAFARNDWDRYSSFLEDASKGKATLKTGNVYPYEMVRPYLELGYDWENYAETFVRDISEEEQAAINATWEALPDFGGNENTLVVVDNSGSMYAISKTPAAVALSLGMYFAERNKGRFAGHFMTFSERPQLIEIKGETFYDRLRYVSSFSEVANTNLEAVFDLVLSTAMKYNLPQEEMPSKLVIISDMEFDRCARNASVSNFQNAKESFEINGYTLPQVVFWNVASGNRHQPVRKNEQGVALVSGCTPKIFEMVAGGNMSPYKLMVETLMSERYAEISA